MAKNADDMIDLLNQSLRLEYSIMIHIPRIANLIEDKDIRESALRLGQDSMKHADVVATAIKDLGGIPTWSFESFPVGRDIVTIFQKQLEKEKLAMQLHQNSASLAHDTALKVKLTKIADEEEWHIQVVNDILSKLNKEL